MYIRSILYSILFLKCPQCRQGDFLEAHPYKLSNMNKVKEYCPKCGLKYSIEPAFYTGSMYVSYGVGIAVAVAAYLSRFDFLVLHFGPTGNSFEYCWSLSDNDALHRCSIKIYLGAFLFQIQSYYCKASKK